MTRILAFSDVHRDLAACATLVAAGAAADIVIGAGDFAQMHEGLEETLRALAPLDAKAVHVVGNNETLAALRAQTGAEVLQGTAIVRHGITIGGIGCAVPPLPPMRWGSNDLTEAQARALLDRIESCDILISHSPPRGVVDRHASLGSIGSLAVREAAERLKPDLLLCGHIHDCWGEEGRIGDTRVVNLGPFPTWFEV